MADESGFRDADPPPSDPPHFGRSPADATRAAGPLPSAPAPDATQVAGPLPSAPAPDATQMVPPVRPTGSDATQPHAPAPGALPDDATRVVGGAPTARPDATSVIPPVGPDGARWEARAQVRSLAPGEGAAGWEEPYEDPYGGRSWFTPVIIGIVALVLLAGLGYAAYAYFDSPENAPTTPASASVPAPTTPAATSAAATSEAPSSAPPSPTVVEQVQVPFVEGETVQSATTKLTARGLKVATEFRPTTAQPAGTVLSTRPGADAFVQPGSTVTLVVANAPSATPTPTRSSAAPSPSPTRTRQ